MVGAEECGEGPGPATGAKILFGPGTGGILWVQWSGLRYPAYESRTNGGAEGVSERTNEIQEIPFTQRGGPARGVSGPANPPGRKK
jgi:hypothetical protein